MNLSKIIENFISTYGRQFYLGDTVSRCILTHKNSLSPDFFREQADRIGRYTNASYIMFIAKTTTLATDDIIEIAGQCYSVDGVEEYILSDTVVYRWAVLRKGGCLS